MRGGNLLRYNHRPENEERMATIRVESKVLADRLIAGEALWHDIVRIAAANILMVLCAWLAVPLAWTPVPITGQTFGVMLVAVLLGSRRGAIVLCLYLLEGAAGLPVFQPFGAPGAARFTGPTAGYLLAFPAAAFLTGWLIERTAVPLRLPRLVAALVAGQAVIFAAGCAWLAAWSGQGLRGTIALGMTPFVPGELIKIAVVVGAVRGVELAWKNVGR